MKDWMMKDPYIFWIAFSLGVAGTLVFILYRMWVETWNEIAEEQMTEAEREFEEMFKVEREYHNKHEKGTGRK